MTKDHGFQSEANEGRQHAGKRMSQTHTSRVGTKVIPRSDGEVAPPGNERAGKVSVGEDDDVCVIDLFWAGSGGFGLAYG